MVSQGWYSIEKFFQVDFVETVLKLAAFATVGGNIKVIRPLLDSFLAMIPALWMVAGRVLCLQ